MAPHWPTEDASHSNDVTACATPSELKQRKPSLLSDASRKYDVGDKGYLDDEERVIRQYDTNNDGSLDLNEIKLIVRDLKDNSKEKRMFKKLAMGAGGCLALVMLGNFGLVWATLILTRQLGAQNGTLVDSSTGKELSTQGSGNKVQISPNLEYAERLRHLLETEQRRLRSGNGGSDVDVRRLTESALGELEGNAAWAAENFADYSRGIDTHFTVEVDDTTFTGEIASTVTFTSVNGCDVYGNIRERYDTEDIVYEVRCCGTSPCTLYHENEESSRRFLESAAQGRRRLCFSPLSTVITKARGKTLLKDLKYGDLVLAAGGRYRLFLTHIHSNPSKPTRFLQMHTDNDEDAPLEASPNHLVFVAGKDLPIPAGKVQVGDKLIGMSGPRAVKKITSITRDGFYSALTSDATHFVDGILASSIAPDDGEEEVVLGTWKVHTHTLYNRVIAPLAHHMCSKIDMHYCSGQVDDGEGGTYNVGIKGAMRIAALHPAVQAILSPLLIALVVTCLLSYYFACALVPSALIVGCISKLKSKKAKVL